MLPYFTEFGKFGTIVGHRMTETFVYEKWN